jgi:hypothetical protein
MPVGHDRQGAGAKHRKVALGDLKKKRSGKGRAKVAWRGKSNQTIFDLSSPIAQKRTKGMPANIQRGIPHIDP